ncbi:hypothetical protein CH263_06275 [Rhodococcus sp. 06-1059B-a]|nr:hypothetical protein [Rhodococcus sp. 06-1059B-a]OZD70523.1 hypothetical protein CH263_06275 [Rhodococcus sp. 06-1059B-a]
MGESSELPTLQHRIDLLFRVWRRPGGEERSSDEIATTLVAGGLAVTAEQVLRWRSGETTPTKAEIEGLAKAFPGESNAQYLLGEPEAASIHSQLKLVLELIEGGIKDVRLRREHAGVHQRELTDLLEGLRTQRLEE